MNNFEKSAEPVSFKKATLGYLGNPANLARATINAINPYSVVVQPSLTALNAARKLNNPIASDTPVLLPNKTKKFFKLLENFVFDDDAQFDFTGDEHLSYKKKDGELSNSNQRTNSGFVDTFKFKRHFGLGTFKIDWIFAKPIIKDDCLGMQDFEDFKPDCKMYYPAFGRTLKDLNESFSSGRISDHAPVTVEIIVGKESEPKLKRKVKKVKAYMV